MNVTYIALKNKYVDSSGRLATVTDYGKNFITCDHNFEDTGRRGTTQGGNGKYVPAAALKCESCGVFMVVELSGLKQ